MDEGKEKLKVAVGYREQVPTEVIEWRPQSKCQLQVQGEATDQLPSSGTKWRSESKCQLQVFVVVFYI